MAAASAMFEPGEGSVTTMIQSDSISFLCARLRNPTNRLVGRKRFDAHHNRVSNPHADVDVQIFITRAGRICSEAFKQRLGRVR